MVLEGATLKLTLRKNGPVSGSDFAPLHLQAFMDRVVSHVSPPRFLRELSILLMRQDFRLQPPAQLCGGTNIINVPILAKVVAFSSCLRLEMIYHFALRASWCFFFFLFPAVSATITVDESSLSFRTVTS